MTGQKTQLHGPKAPQLRPQDHAEQQQLTLTARSSACVKANVARQYQRLGRVKPSAQPGTATGCTGGKVKPALASAANWSRRAELRKSPLQSRCNPKPSLCVTNTSLIRFGWDLLRLLLHLFAPEGLQTFGWCNITLLQHLFTRARMGGGGGG
jgi:hypothetical protein